MALTGDEVVELSQEAIELVTAIGAATKAASDGGRKITKSERQSLGKLALELAKHFLVDLAD